MIVDSHPETAYWIYLGLSLACAGFVQGLSGFGFGMVSMSLMPLFMGVKQAAVISTAFTLLSTVITFARHYREYNWRLGAEFILSVCVGLPLGVFFLERTSETLLIRLLGGLMVVYALREFLFPPRNQPFREVWSIPLGLFSGFMSGAFNLGGVPSAAYAYSHPWSRGQIMAFLQVMITLSCVLRMVFYHHTGLVGGIPWGSIVFLALPLFGTIWLGHYTLSRLHPRRMRQIIFAFIGASGTYYLLVR